jgi:hypothetical protein
MFLPCSKIKLSRGEYPGNWVNAVNGVKGAVETVKVHIEFSNITVKMKASILPSAISDHTSPTPFISTQPEALVVFD